MNMGMQIGLSPKNPPVRLISMNILNNTIFKYQTFPVSPCPSPPALLMESWTIVCSIFPTYYLYTDRWDGPTRAAL